MTNKDSKQLLRHLSQSRLRWLTPGGMIVFASLMFGCTMPSPGPVQVNAMAPEVSYTFTTDEDLIKANNRARDYCSQYASSPIMEGTITRNQDGTKAVTFTCVNEPANTPATMPDSLTYRNDNDLLRAMHSADVYCAKTGQRASYSVTTNAVGTQTLTYRCVPR